MNRSPEELLPQLLDLIRRLYADTQGMLEDPGDQQLWYDRGYANGMVGALRDLGYGARLNAELTVDPPDLIAGQETLPWGRAYAHGLATGGRETQNLLASREGHPNP